MSAEKYNGWTNYETWNYALWLDNDRDMANARLIAAAPELFAALQAVVDARAIILPKMGPFGQIGSGLYDAAHAALAKATGEQA